MDELISVIVPVYKVEKYLDQCVQSIVDQTYRNLEIILVDDGSPDNCPQMCDEWAKRDSRIRVIHQENQGAGAARNRGLEAAAGQWIAFVDSDDYLADGIYEHLSSLLMQGADIAECNHTEVREAPFSFSESEEAIRWFTPEEAMSEHIRDGIFRQLIWNKLYTRAVIGKVRFTENTRIDDEFFTWRVLANAERLVRSERIGYAYRQQPGSVMHNLSPERRFQAVEAKCQRHDYLAEHFPALVPQSLENLWFTCLYQGQLILRETPEAQKVFNQLQLTLRRYPLNGHIKGRSVKSKVWLTLAQSSFSAACRLRNALKIGF